MRVMGRVRQIAVLGAATALVFATAAMSREYGPVHSVPQGSFAHRLLRAHNVERERVGVPALRWSDRLAEQAQSWAQELSRKGAMVHADRATRKGAGENLWTGHAGWYTAEEMVGGFIDEKHLFVNGTFPKNSRSGKWPDVAHYTQLIWRETTEVGCAVAAGKGQDYLVCRYWPAGNVYGKPVY